MGERDEEKRCDQYQTATKQVNYASLIDELFTYHPPSGMQHQAYETIRDAAKHLAVVIIKNCPSGADRTAAIRKLRESVMTANAAIALNGISL